MATKTSTKTATTKRSTKSTKSTEQKAAVMSARWKMLMDLAEQMEAAMEADEDVAATVEALAVQTGYSIRNAALILGQCQHARQVHSFRAWKEHHARQVRKGEKALYVLAPTAKKKAQTQAADTTTEAPAPAAATTAPAPTETAQGGQDEQDGQDGEAKQHRNFVLVPVFDLSQTEPVEAGKPVEAGETQDPAAITEAGGAGEAATAAA